MLGGMSGATLILHNFLQLIYAWFKKFQEQLMKIIPVNMIRHGLNLVLVISACVGI